MSLKPYRNEKLRPSSGGLKSKLSLKLLSKNALLAVAVLLFSLTGILIDYNFSFDILGGELRFLSKNLGGGKCEWTGASELDPNSNPYGTLFASYPGSGMRLLWQMVEGLTGILVGDDFFYSGKVINGLVKTQYPHPEGIWSYGSAMDQTVLLVRNPRWNIPSYHTTLYELEYAHDYKVAYENMYRLFTARAPMDYWVRWRDYRFHDEINLWAWQIHFWMENGTQFWDPLDLERAGQYPFSYLNESQNKPKDEWCRNFCDCVPKAVVSYETIKSPVTGPLEVRKIAKVLRFKKKISVIEDETMECIWNETFIKAPEKRNENRDGGRWAITEKSHFVRDAKLDKNNTYKAADYTFTKTQMQTILSKVIEVKNKYSNEPWVKNRQARDLTVYLHSYIKDIALEIEGMQEAPPPTPSPVADVVNHRKGEVEWYNNIGRGNKYAKDIVQHMSKYWSMVKDLYNGTEPEPLGCDSDYNESALDQTAQDWLYEHNWRRKQLYDIFNMTHQPLEWSEDLAESAQGYADKLADKENIFNHTACHLQNGLGKDYYGTQNIGLNRGSEREIAQPEDLLKHWHDKEINLTSMELIGKKFHASMALFRSSHYVGCGTASMLDPEKDDGSYCHFHVCRYLGPGNCFLEALLDVYPSFEGLFPPNCTTWYKKNYWLCSVLSDFASSICQHAPERPMYPKDKCQ